MSTTMRTLIVTQPAVPEVDTDISVLPGLPLEEAIQAIRLDSVIASDQYLAETEVLDGGE